MSKKWFAVIGAVLVLVVAGMVGCGTDGATIGGDGTIDVSLNSQQEGIVVSGTGKVYATPDVAVLSLGVEVQATTVAEAQAQASQAMDAVVAALRAGGVAEKDIQTQYFNIREVNDWERELIYDDGGISEKLVIVGYEVTNTVTAKVRDVTEVGAVIDAVAVAGGDYTRFNSISFTVDDPSPYYEQAREDAVDYAQAKAQQLAQATGVTLGKPTYVSESTYMPSPNYYARDVAMEAAGAVTTSISAGEMEITTTVQITYAIAD